MSQSDAHPRKSSSQMAYHPPLVISVHGIHTDGEWQKVFSSALSGSPVRTESFDYGRYGLIRFLNSLSRNRMVGRFYNWYATITKSCPGVDLDCYNKRPSVVAHSFGTWIVGYAMLKYMDVRFDKIILVGSILPRDFDWVTLFGRDQVGSVLNEQGERDPWPRRASRFVRGTGTSGSEGFDWVGSNIANITREWFGHSDALVRQHIEKHWLPALSQAPCLFVIRHGRDLQRKEDFVGISKQMHDLDYEAFGHLRNYKEVTLSLALTWVRVNPDIYTFLIDRQTGQPAGYLNSMPVEDACYDELRSGRIVDIDIKPNEILPYLGRETVKLYITSIVIGERYRRWGDGFLQQGYAQLLTGFLDKLIFYAKRYSARVTHVLAIASTPEGERMCKFFAMTKVGKNDRDEDKDPIFELDLESLRSAKNRKLPAHLRRLLDVYEKLRGR